MSSSGGNVAEGITLHNLMIGMPYRLHTHNLNIVQSIAIIVFLAGSTRTMSPEASFLLHGFTWTFGNMETLDETQIADRASDLSASRTEFVRIFERNTKLQAKDFDERALLKRANVLAPNDALAAGIVSKIENYKHPPGVSIHNIVV